MTDGYGLREKPWGAVLWDRIMLGCVVFCASAMVYGLYRAFIPETALTVSVNPLPVVVDRFGELPGTRSITYRLHYCKSVDSPSTVVRELRAVDSPRIVSLYTSGYSLPKGCDVVDIVEPMPGYIPAGHYILRITFTYRVNAVTSPYTFETEPFELK